MLMHWVHGSMEERTGMWENESQLGHQCLLGVDSESTPLQALFHIQDKDTNNWHLNQSYWFSSLDCKRMMKWIKDCGISPPEGAANIAMSQIAVNKPWNWTSELTQCRYLWTNLGINSEIQKNIFLHVQSQAERLIQGSSDNQLQMLLNQLILWFQLQWVTTGYACLQSSRLSS